ncbi:hypothetical protein [Streptomyces sp. NPDC058155]|uniref:hypothetical protein n=1 Tax=Streptomyces sp. NPDC058155 TaxID=3346359 RepID=UPI0036EA4705
MTMPYDYRAERVRKYFIPTPPRPTPEGVQGPLSWGLVGIVFALAGLPPLMGGEVLIGLLLVAGGGFGGWHQLREFSSRRWSNRQDLKRFERAYAAAEPKATDDQMNEWLDESLGLVAHEGLSRLGLTRDDLPPVKNLPNRRLPLIGMPSHGRVSFAKGADRVLRCSAYHVAIIYFTKWKLCVVEVELDMATGSFIGESIQEFLYKDINTLGVRSDRVSLPDPTSVGVAVGVSAKGHRVLNTPAPPGRSTPPRWHSVTRQEIRFGVAGDHFSIAVGIDSRETSGPSVVGRPGNTVDAAVALIRQMLYEYGSRGKGGPGSTDDPA